MHVSTEIVLLGKLISETLSSVSVIDDDTFSTVWTKVHIHEQQWVVITLALFTLSLAFTDVLELTLVVIGWVLSV